VPEPSDAFYLVVETSENEMFEFCLISSFDKIHWWSYCLTKQEFVVLTLGEECG